MNTEINYTSHTSVSWFWCRSSELVELEFGDVGCFDGGKPGGEPGEKPLGARWESKVRANSKIGPHMKSGWNRTQATLMGGERSHHSVRHSWPCAKVIYASRWGRVSDTPSRRPCQEFVSFLQVRQNLGPSIPYSYFEMQMLIV